MNTQARIVLLSDLQSELDRVSFGDVSVSVPLDEDALSVQPYDLVRLSWGCGESEFYFASDLQDSLAEIEDDTDPDAVYEGLPEAVDNDVTAAILEVEDRLAAVDQARHQLREARHRWHRSKPLAYADFVPVRYIRGGDVDYCYGALGEVAECRCGKLTKDEKQLWAVQPGPDVDRINRDIGALIESQKSE